MRCNDCFLSKILRGYLPFITQNFISSLGVDASLPVYNHL